MFENVIDIFVGNHKEILDFNNFEETIPKITRTSNNLDGKFVDNEKGQKYYSNNVDKDLAPYTLSDDTSPWRKKVSDLNYSSIGKVVNQNCSYDLEKRAMLNVCNDLSREIAKIKVKLDNNND